MNSNNALSVWHDGYGPFSELRREIGRLFDNVWTAAPESAGWRASESQWHPACDIEETEDHYLLTLDMPGVSKDQVKIEVVDNQLLISGERTRERKSTEGGSWYSERRYGKFQRSFALPAGISSEKVEANYQDGTLRIFVPKAESAKPRQVKISGGTQLAS